MKIQDGQLILNYDDIIQVDQVVVAIVQSSAIDSRLSTLLSPVADAKSAEMTSSTSFSWQDLQSIGVSLVRVDVHGYCVHCCGGGS